MVRMQLAAGAATAAMVVVGLGSTTATPAFADGAAAPARCTPIEALEGVNVHVTDDGRPPDAAGPAPPKNDSERNRDRVVGVLQKGEKACTAGRAGQGATYDVGGACTDGKSSRWTPIRFDGHEGWVPTSCVR